jgi:exodeoxyribonuclease V gamma subunit
MDHVVSTVGRVLHVLYSNRFEELVSALADDLAQARRGGAIDPLAPLDVVVPSQMVAAYARREVARQSGIAANLRFPFLDRFLADLCQAGRPWRVLDRRLLQVLILALLAEAGDGAGRWHRDLAPVRDYVGAGSGPAEVRRVQLAGELADLFLGYAMSRPEMVAGWADGRGEAPGGLERWQRQLWRSLFGPDGLAARLAGPDARWGLMGELFAALSPGQLTPGGPVHMLGFSYLERGTWPILERLARACDLRIYALNPCREFWDDLASATRPRTAAPSGGEEPPALQLWGRPGREHVAGLNRLCGWDFRDRFAVTERRSALASLQQDILDRAPARSLADRPAAPRGDRSVQILACPGIRRELEVIGNQIAALLVEDETLRLCDIAVLLAPDEAERYQAQVGAVFGELGGIPHRLADLPLQSESRLVEAIDLLFDLPLGRLTRPELLGLMVHPAVMAGHPEIDRDDWIRWCDELGIVHGGDQRDHRGTYIERDVFNWDQGVRRLALGSFMSNEGEGGLPPALRLSGQVYRPARVAPDERRSAARFALLARSLIADARACRGEDRPLAAWARHLDALAASYLVPVTPADERALDRCRDAIRQLADLDLGGAPIGYRTARELAREALTGLRSGGGELPSDAVLVAPLAPMRPLPFRVLFLAGLGAGRFPGRDREAGLDLRAGAPRPGDVGARERDRYTFLEAVLSARDRIALSYVARDEETGEELEPSSVVHELRDMIQPYLAAADAAAVVVRHPLRRYAAAGGRDPIALRQAASAALRRDLVEHCAARGAPVPSAAEMMAELGRPERAGLRARVGLPALPEVELRAAERGSEPLVLQLSILRRFLECPLQAWATAVLGLRQEDDEDLVAQRDEPFERDILSSTIAMREVFLAHLAAGGRDPAALDRRYRERLAFDEQSGQAPTGPFARGDERKAGQVLRAWWDALVRAAGGDPPAPQAVGFGWAGESDRTGVLLEPIELTISGGRQVFLVGRTEPVAERFGSLLMVAGDDPSPRYRVRGAIDQAALAACELLPEDGRHLITILAGSGKPHRFRLGPASPASARAYLGQLAEELLSRAHDYLLPCEAVLGRKGRRENGGLREAIRDLVAGGRFFSSRGGPLRIGPELAPPPDADAMVARRFGPWLDRMEALRD